jgi:hypothetical protein
MVIMIIVVVVVVVFILQFTVTPYRPPHAGGRTNAIRAHCTNTRTLSLYMNMTLD